MSVSRREVLRSLGGGGAVGAFACAGRRGLAQNLPGTPSVSAGAPTLVAGSISVSGSVTLPASQESGIKHIVVVMMENRSFDHFLGWVPGADGKQNLSYSDKNNVSHPAHRLAPDYTGCGHPDPDHSYTGGRTAYNHGAMDGFLRAGSNDVFAVGYYTDQDLNFYSALARNYLVCDRYFASFLGPTFPNRMFQWAAQTDRTGDTVSLSHLPTIFDRLNTAGVSHRYYFNNLPVLAFWGLKYIFSTSLFSDFLEHATRGTLPAVSFVDPNFTVLDDGTGNDDHPHADIRNGDAFLARIFHALAGSPAWQNTVLIINFDEWGGFFEHVAPPRVAKPNDVDKDQVNNQVLLGFRLPTIIASPFTRNSGTNPLVSSVVFDHTSVLKLIEWRCGLQPLTARDASAQIGNLAVAMNFASPDARVPALPSPGTFFAPPCFGGGIFTGAAPIRRTPESLPAATPPATEWGALARTRTVRQWLDHPRFQNRVTP